MSVISLRNLYLREHVYASPVKIVVWVTCTVPFSFRIASISSTLEMRHYVVLIVPGKWSLIADFNFGRGSSTWTSYADRFYSSFCF